MMGEQTLEALQEEELDRVIAAAREGAESGAFSPGEAAMMALLSNMTHQNELLLRQNKEIIELLTPQASDEPKVEESVESLINRIRTAMAQYRADLGWSPNNISLTSTQHLLLESADYLMRNDLTRGYNLLGMVAVCWDGDDFVLGPRAE